MSEAKQRSEAELAYRIKHQWRVDVVLATWPGTTGNSDDRPIHMICLAMFGLWPRDRPALFTAAKVDINGILYAPIQFDIGGKWHIARLGPVQVITDTLRRVADKCKLRDVEREQLFQCFRMWISEDARATALSRERVRVNSNI